jgi:Tol biopolymer transport system component
MSLSPGTKLGPYEILAPLGAGGMGEVYRARDSRLRREVAVKVLSPEFSADAQRRSRFEQEAHAASALNHPNIIAIYDIGSAETGLWVAMECVEGKTLRELTESGRLPASRVLDVGAQIAEGLARAHAAGIVHRDLKPENVMISKDGFVKILDFGLAKLSAPLGGSDSNLPTAAPRTDAGTIMGTVGYMSPEQATGRPVDFRSDQFSLGAMLYEMAAGKRPFQRESAPQTLTAIIQEDPEPLGTVSPRTPAPLRWIVERCLAKEADDRYASTKDLARDLKSIRDHLSEASVSGAAEGAGALPRAARASGRAKIAAAVGALALLVAGAVAGYRYRRAPVPVFHRLTYRRGTIRSARFAPGGPSIVYSASWEEDPIRVFTMRPDNPDSIALPVPDSVLFSVSSTGEMAIGLHPAYFSGFDWKATLARVPLSGGTPREVVDDVDTADWAPDGSGLAIDHIVGGKSQVEYPIGKTLFASTGWISHLRVSPRGDRIAFLDHPIRNDDGGSVVVVDLAGKHTELSRGWSTAEGLAWSRDGSEVWFSATRESAARAVYAVSLAGRERLVLPTPRTLTLDDISADGRMLMSEDDERMVLRVLPPGAKEDREFSYLDWTLPRDLSADGKLLLFDESGEGGGNEFSTYLRNAESGSVVRLGSGSALALSPDGLWVASTSADNRQLFLLPTRAGQARTLTTPGFRLQSLASFFPKSPRLLFVAQEGSHGARLYVQDLAGGKPAPISGETIAASLIPISPDEAWIAARALDDNVYLFPVPGGAPKRLPGTDSGDWPIRWTADGMGVYVFRRGQLPADVFRVDVATGRRDRVTTLKPPEAPGLASINRALITPDGKSWAYSYQRTLSDLFVVEKIR